MLPLLRKWAPALLGIILISPLFSLPRPANISSIPWLVELLFSAFLIVFVLTAFGSQSFRAVLSNAFADRNVRIIAVLVVGFCAWSAASAAWSESPTAAAHHTLLWANYTIVFLFAFVIASIRNGTSSLLLALGTSAILIGTLAAFDFLTIQDFSSQEGTLRIRYAKFAEMLAVIAPVLFSAAIVMRSRQKFAAALMIGSVAWAGVMLSLSKGAFLAGVAGFLLLFVFLVLFKRDQFRKVLIAASVWTLVTVVFQFGISNLTTVPSTVNYISGSADATRSTSSMRKFTWRVAGEMIVFNPISGVGADNFGLEFNSSRSSLAETNQEDADASIGEYYVFERAHNEPLQIFAELGLVGITIFGAFVFATVFFLGTAVYRRCGGLSPMFFGGVAGIAAFAISSLVSSFSFRAYQNGIVFFIILGLTLALAQRKRRRMEIGNSHNRNLIKQLSLGVAALLLIFSTLKAGSRYIHFYGERSTDLATATKYFEMASSLDPDNPGAELAAADAFAHEKLWADAVPHYRRAIGRGFGVSVVFSYLANAQEMSGDLGAAETTLKEAVSIFPRSSFLRARLAVVQEKLGKQEEAGKQIKLARYYDERQTNGWYAVIKDGILNAHLKATADPTHFAAPPELLPENAIHAYNTEKVRVE